MYAAFNLCKSGNVRFRGGGAVCRHTYTDIISLENLFEAWGEFSVGKKGKRDVQEFARNLMTNLISLQESLADGTYFHAQYNMRIINDPKRRVIHVASVRDRVLHRAIYRKLYPFFDTLFIADSFSCRNNKGTHKALERFGVMARKVSKNNRRTAWVLKCDVRLFFASIDHRVLMKILASRIANEKVLGLLESVIGSFSSSIPGVGLPLGNLTSQLLANVYLNELDRFVKQRLRVKYYIRYADDFVLLSRSKSELRDLLYAVSDWLELELRLWLHPQKVSLSTVASGVDFLGWVHFPHCRILRETTKRRMLKNLRSETSEASVASYLGLLRHGDAHGLALAVSRVKS